jgi:hypothetical protein
VLGKGRLRRPLTTESCDGTGHSEYYPESMTDRHRACRCSFTADCSNAGATSHKVSRRGYVSIPPNARHHRGELRIKSRDCHPSIHCQPPSQPNATGNIRNRPAEVIGNPPESFPSKLFRESQYMLRTPQPTAVSCRVRWRDTSSNHPNWRINPALIGGTAPSVSGRRSAGRRANSESQLFGVDLPGGGCPSRRGNFGSIAAHVGAIEVQIVASGDTQLGSSRVPTRTPVKCGFVVR